VSSKSKAVLIGLDSITGLQTARILAGRGVDVIAIAGDHRNFCCRTRVCERIIEADIEGEGLIEVLAGLGRTLEERAVLVPCTDPSVLLISRHRQELERSYHVVLPEPPTVEMLVHKVSFFTYAERAGLAIPPTAVLANGDDAERAAETLRFPVILKPSLKAHPTWRSHFDVKAAKLSTPGELLSAYDRVGGETEAEALIAQQWVESGDASLFSCNCYFDRDSKPLVTFVARKLRQWPPRVGTSSLGEECHNDVVLEETIRLFEGVRFRGLGYLEMKRDGHTGEHFIIEPNVGRPTGRSAIAEAGGVELLYTKYCDAVGLPLPAETEQRYTGAKWVDLVRDFRSAAYYWRRGELTLGEWRRSWSGSKAHAVLSWSDPAPFLGDLWQSAGKAAGRNHAAGEAATG
jgi:predicted ATP-grasp superfamily ATP-dependent carboligase